MDNQDDKLELDDDFLADDFDDDLALEDFDDDLGIEDFDEGLLDDLQADLHSDGEVQSDITGASPNGLLQAKGFKQKTSLPFNLSFNSIVIIGAVLLGGIVLFFQFNSAKNEANLGQGERFVSSLGVEGSTEVLSNDGDKLNPESQKAAGGGFLNDNLDDLPEETQQLEEYIELPMPTPVSEENLDINADQPDIADSLEFLTSMEKDDYGDVVQADNIEAPRPPEDIENIKEDSIEDISSDVSLLVQDDKPSAKMQSDINEENTDIVTSVSKAPASIETIVASNEKVAPALSQKIDKVLERIDGLEDKIEAIDEASSQRAAIVEDSVAALEKKISKIENMPKASSASRANTSSAPRETKSVKSKGVSWQLKAAQPSKAWISKRGQSLIRPVKVGDAIEGIGRIESIQLVDGRWVVKGSSGTIKQ